MFKNEIGFLSKYMLAAQTELKYAQQVKEFIRKKNIGNLDYLLIKELGFIYFPIVKKMKIPLANVVDTKFAFPMKPKEQTIEDVLKDKLTAKELALIPRSQEIIGAILILEIPDELRKKERVIAEGYLKINKSLETVVGKDEIHTGQFRTRTVQVLAGKNQKEAVHLENGVKVKLHLDKVYFSARSGHERLRIAKLVKKNERVLVMFSGAAPFPLTIAKNSPAKEVYGIEINPAAHVYAVGNVAENKLQNKIVLREGDVRIVLPLIKCEFDRIVMPLPKTSEEFLPLALTKIKKGGMIHLYAFLEEMEIGKYKKQVKELCGKRVVKIMRVVKCGQFSPRVFRMCLDIKVLN